MKVTSNNIEYFHNYIYKGYYVFGGDKINDNGTIMHIIIIIQTNTTTKDFINTKLKDLQKCCYQNATIIGDRYLAISLFQYPRTNFQHININ